MPEALIAALVGAISGVAAVFVSRHSPLGPLQRTYVSELEGRSNFLASENADLKVTISRLRQEIDALRQEIDQLRKEVRQLERENLDLYRGTGLSRRDTQGRYISTKDDQLDG